MDKSLFALSWPQITAFPLMPITNSTKGFHGGEFLQYCLLLLHSVQASGLFHSFIHSFGDRTDPECCRVTVDRAEVGLPQQRTLLLHINNLNITGEQLQLRAPDALQSVHDLPSQ